MVLCWTPGTFPSIAISDIHIDSTTIPPGDSAITHLVARADLAAIEETIYLEIYANQVKPKIEDQVRQLVTKLLRRLQDWLADSTVDLGYVENGSDSSAWKIELAIHFFCAQLLPVWSYKDHPDVMFQRRVDVARRCTRLLLRLWSSTPDEGLHAALPRLVLSNIHYFRNEW